MHNDTVVESVIPTLMKRVERTPDMRFELLHQHVRWNLQPLAHPSCLQFRNKEMDRYLKNNIWHEENRQCRVVFGPRLDGEVLLQP